MEKYNFYEIEYLSVCLVKGIAKTVVIKSNKSLSVGDTIVVEKENNGVFLGRVFKEIEDNKERVEYRYVQDIDLKEYFAGIEREKRKEELKKEMEKKFAEIDKIKKYEYYANLDDSFKAIYDEYKMLGGK